MSRFVQGFLSTVLAAVCLAAAIPGCRDTEDAGNLPAGPGEANHDAAKWQREQFNWPIDNLNRIDEFDSSELFEKIVSGLKATGEPGGVGPAAPSGTNPLLATWPEPEVLRQGIERLNQWLEVGQFPSDWKADGLLATLPESFKKLPMVEDLDALKFTRYDEYALLEAVWLRDVSNWARGDELDELRRAVRLFDWTVRNIQLQPDASEAPKQVFVPQMPWEAMFFGNGTALERAWMFILLARQQGLDAAMLALDDAEGSAKRPKPWAVAVLIGGKAYLFDAALGVPIPAPDGISSEGEGQLAIRPATLEEVVGDEKLLRRLDADEKHPYWVKADDLKRVVALVEASPAYLSKRMGIVESRLVGEQKMILTTDATAHAARWKAVPHVTDARLWLLPYETFATRLVLPVEGIRQRLSEMIQFYGVPNSLALRRGRMLYLKGRFIGEPGATNLLQEARPSNEHLEAARKKTAADFVNNAIERLPEKQRAARRAEIESIANQEALMRAMIMLRAKQDASYWLGLVTYERGDYASAVDYFINRTLQPYPEGPWTRAARYNLARTCEAMGETAKAAELYRSDDDSVGYAGNLLRAKWLTELASRPK